MRAVRVLIIMAATAVMAACSSSPPEPAAVSGGEPTTVRLLTHDSFALSDAVIADFEVSSGIDLEIVPGGDAGEMVNRAVLAAGKPEADVLFGIDSSLLTRALDANVFEPYVSTEAGQIRPELAGLGQGVVTAVDDGDVCINIDDGWFAERGIPAPTTLDDLTRPEYRGLLVVQNPATSSPGLAFLLATIARYGDDWAAYWQALRSNDVRVVNGWSEAYLGEFSAGGGDGDRPLVVSYSTSPPAEIVYAAEPKPEQPSTSTMTDGCYRQVEFAGVLAGSPQPQAARAVVDWLLSPQVQADVPLSMFVFPARQDVPLPEVFTRFVRRPSAPLELPAGDVAAGRDAWIEQWNEIVLR